MAVALAVVVEGDKGEFVAAKRALFALLLHAQCVSRHRLVGA